MRSEFKKKTEKQQTNRENTTLTSQVFTIVNLLQAKMENID